MPEPLPPPAPPPRPRPCAAASVVIAIANIAAIKIALITTNRFRLILVHPPNFINSNLRSEERRNARQRASYQKKMLAVSMSNDPHEIVQL
jgi:hypothetical protein